MSAKKYTNLTKPITVTIDGNLAAAVRFPSFVQMSSTDEVVSYVLEAVKRRAACDMTSITDDEAEEFVGIKEDAA